MNINQQLLYFFKWQHLNWVPIFSGSCHHLLKPKAGWNEKYCYNSAHTLISCGVTDFILRFLWAPEISVDSKTCLSSRPHQRSQACVQKWSSQTFRHKHLWRSKNNTRAPRKDYNLKKARLTPYFDQLVCTAAGKPFSIGGELHTWHRLKKKFRIFGK